MKLYVAGKIQKESTFGTHYWRKDFVEKLRQLSGVELDFVDPLADENLGMSTKDIFQKNCRQIHDSDVCVVYLSNDIAVGGAQEILIARYFNKPVLGLAPLGGKFNGATREMFGKTITDYKDPFVFTTCDQVCATIEELAEALKKPLPVSSGLSIIEEAIS
jgi:hypothetical protein